MLHHAVARPEIVEARSADAEELLHDDVGDDDTLCESNERCVVAPNFGAYQGTGDLEGRTCTFQGGVVTGVTMYGYPTN